MNMTIKNLLLQWLCHFFDVLETTFHRLPLPFLTMFDASVLYHQSLLQSSCPSVSYEYPLIGCGNLSKLKIPENYRIPNEKDLLFLVKYCSWTWVPIHGRNGMAIRAKSDLQGNGFFIFLPSYVKTHDVDPDDDPLAAGLSWKNTYWGEEYEGFVDGFRRFNLLYFSRTEHKIECQEEDPECIFERVYAFALRFVYDD